MTVTSPSSTQYTFSTGVASSKAPPPGRKCEMAIQKLRVLETLAALQAQAVTLVVRGRLVGRASS